MRSAFQILKDTFSRIFSSPKVFLSIIALPALIAVGISVIEPETDIAGNFMWDSSMNGMHEVLYYVAIFLSIVANMYMTVAIVFAVSNKELTAIEAYKFSFTKIFAYFVLTVVTLIILMLATLLLIIPGIWLSISFLFAMYFLILRNAGVTDSLKMSFALVRGRWWKVFGKILMFGLFFIILIISIDIVLWVVGSAVGDVFTYAIELVLEVLLALVAVIFTYELFNDLEKTKDTGVIDTAVTNPLATLSV